ncbi:MAG: hypothetical protein IT384_32335 [Deltaproteobacteria bacterium]|nr:hypothetical protein [Deltaproteobacteria bacterium]
MRRLTVSVLGGLLVHGCGFSPPIGSPAEDAALDDRGSGADQGLLDAAGSSDGGPGADGDVAGADSTPADGTIPGPDTLVFVTPPRVATAGECSAALTLESRASDGAASTSPQPRAIELTAAPPLDLSFFSDAACATPVASATIAAGSSQVNVYVRATRAGSPILTAAGADFTAIATQLLTVAPAAPAAMVFTSPAPRIQIDACSPPATIELRDAFGNAAPAGATRAVSLTATPPSGFTFSEDAACGGQISTALFGPADSTLTMYFRGRASGAVEVRLESAGLTPATQIVTVTSGAPSTLVFTSAPQQLSAGDCSLPVVFETRDGADNPSNVASDLEVGLAPLGSALAFYADSACSAAVTSATVLRGTNTATFHFSTTTAGVFPLQISASGYAPATQDAIIDPAPAESLVFVSTPQQQEAGACSDAETIESRDRYGNASAVGAPSPIALTALPAQRFAFFADASCSSTVTSVALGAGESKASFHHSGTLPGSVLITGNSGALGTTTQTTRIIPAPPSALAFVTPPQTLEAGFCSPAVVLESRDAFGNAAPVASDRAVLLSSSSSEIAFFDDPLCTNETDTVTFVAGSDSTAFYFRGSEAVVADVTATAPFAPSAVQTEVITAECTWPFTASNVDPCDAATPRPAGPLTLTELGLYIYDTDQGTLRQPNNASLAPPSALRPQNGGPEVRVLVAGSLALGPLSVLRIIGTRPLVIVVHGDTTIAGPIAATAGRTAGCPSTGNGAGGGDAIANNAGGGGGGGGAHGTGAPFGGRGGGSGSSRGAGGNGGAINGDPDVTPLRGGCDGGEGGDTLSSIGVESAGGRGGRGGGALQIIASGSITIEGSIAANGDGGNVGDPGGVDGGGGGGAGGSGGALFFEASRLDVTGTGRLCANGGSGAQGSGSTSGAPGIAGSCSLTPATTPSLGTGGGAGGRGGALDTAPGGGSTGPDTRGGGGAGGSVGRIRLRAARRTIDSGAVVTPAPSS